jgi:hypothetical protein
MKLDLQIYMLEESIRYWRAVVVKLEAQLEKLKANRRS